MGSFPSRALQDGIAGVSPWMTLVHIDNQTNQPVIVHLARNADMPTAEDAVEHIIPANEVYGLASGWLREPRATLLIRTGVDKAQLLRVPNNARIMIRLAPHGLCVDSPDAVEFEPFEPAHDVSGHDTVPMALRGESFHVEPTGPSVAQAAVSAAQREQNQGRGQALRGIRFLVAPASVDDDPWTVWSSVPPLRVAATADVVRLARAVLLERRMRSRQMPILLEATCSRRHAYVMCKALARAQQLSMLLSSEPSGISCIARITKRYGPHTPTDEAGNTARLIRVMVWKPVSITGEIDERKWAERQSEADVPRPPPAPVGKGLHGSWPFRGASSPALLVAALVPFAAKVQRACRARLRATSIPTVAGTEIWSLLGLKGTATKAEIKSKFKKFVRTNHPDVKGDRSPAAIERWANITEAYRKIMKCNDDLFWVESWVARVRQIEIAKLQNADRIRQERIARRAARVGLTPDQYEAAEAEAVEAAKEAAEIEEDNRNQFVLDTLPVVLALVLAFLMISLIAILVNGPNSK
ncbi:unnamed protein product [Cladocopium goreaui]|uniref:Chaperone protein dnaJ A6, chloroplastic (AtDjA6) (Chaperone protein dnaJ A26) (AtDjA26) n=1 Tax=Cladocopium goreaui TaxID=2562237 RepID=A0A9P1FVJ9_9DINO|nr:unnamed protein product [Cladocopium goreaui]